MPQETKWKKQEDVEWLKVSDMQIGQGVYGKVYIGRIKFKGQQPARIAVKRFLEPPTTDSHVASYENVIRKLKASGAQIVKTGFVKHEGEWMQVQPLFGATAKGSKLKRLFVDWNYVDPEINLSDEQKRKSLMGALAKVMDAGYPPMFDAIGMVTGTTPMFVVHDLDLLAMHERGENHGFTQRREFIRWIRAIAKNSELPLEKVKEELIGEVKDTEVIATLKKIDATKNY